LATLSINVSDGLNPTTAHLVKKFAEAMAAKLHSSQYKYGYGDQWAYLDQWSEADCQKSLAEHVAKGDPIDVANYCAFMHWHDWRTTPYVWPKCKDCGDRFIFQGDEPFAYCSCGTTEWGNSGRPPNGHLFPYQVGLPTHD
jgi:hypothetical protein